LDQAVARLAPMMQPSDAAIALNAIVVLITERKLV
jgi:hypothetical protein